MHIASALTVVRREPVQSDVAMPRGRLFGRLDTPTTGWRKALPGAILIMVLAALGAAFPMLF